MKAKITKRLVDDTSATAKPRIIFDTEVPGFVLKCTPAGRKVFQLRYRIGGRSTPLRTYTLGTFGTITAEQARRSAQMLLGDVKRGIDPAAEKAKRELDQKGALTLAAVAADFQVIHLAKRKRRTVIEYGKLLELVILPALGAKPIAAILIGDVERWHHGLRGTPYHANRALAVLSKLLNWAAGRGYRSADNPCKSVEKFKEQARERYLSPAEIAAVGGAIRSCEVSLRITPWQAALFRMLLLTGLRKDEVRTLEWRCVDLERGVLILEDTKTGRRDVPISGPVRQLFGELPRIDGHLYVFPGKSDGPVVNLAKPWARVLKEAGIAPTRLHDLRHTAASVGVTAGASLMLIGGVLGHKSAQTTSRYAHLADDPVRATSEVIADRVSAAMNNTPGEVLPLPMRKK